MEEKDPKKYEIGYLIREEQDAKEIKDLLLGYKAEIINEGRIRKIRLAYPIKKEINGYFGYLHFSLVPHLIKDLSNQLRLNAKILRMTIFVLPKESKDEFFSERKNEKPMAPKEKTAKPAEVPKKQNFDAVNTELLEKKLEEILK